MSNRRQAARRATITTAAGLALALLLTGAGFAQDTVCADFDKRHTISALGGANAFSTAGADSLDELQALFVEHRDDLERVLAERGVQHLTEKVFQAIASGDGVVERDLRNGETFQWMSLRRKGVPASAGPLCVNSKKTWGAWEITVSTSMVASSKPPTCELSVSGDCAGGMLTVDASGSSSGVEVTMSGPEGAKSIISGGSTSWEGSFDQRYQTEYTFTATGEKAAGTDVTTYTFVIPKACLNLALAKEEKSSGTGEMMACEKTVTVDACAAGAAACSLALATDRTRTKEEVAVTATGHFPGGLEGRIVDPKGNEVSPFEFTDGSANLSMDKVGRYTVQATATNEVGETAVCEADLRTGPRWVIRAFGGPGYTKGDDFSDVEEVAVPFGAGAAVGQAAEFRTKAVVDNGRWFGLDAEYLFNNRWGLEADVHWGRIDARFMADTADEWEMDDDKLGATTFAIGPNFHLTPNSMIDFYLGAQLAFVSYDDPTFQVFGETVESNLDNETTFGLLLGADFPLGNSPWAIGVAYRYLDLSAQDKDDNDVKLDISPSILTGGLSFRF